MSDVGAYEEPSSTSDIVLWAKNKTKAFLVDASHWREEARQSYGCVAGDQWDEEAKGILEEQGRPVFTFNRVAGFIRGICGLEASARNEVRYYAREVSDSGVGDVLNAAVDWARDNCDAEDEESDAFKDMLICGVGWTETFISTEDDPDGQIEVARVDPLHMRWDPGSRKRGLADSEWRSRVKWLSYDTVEALWGREKAEEVRDRQSGESERFTEDEGTPGDSNNDRDDYGDNDNGSVRKRRGICVEQFQYRKVEWVYPTVNPETGQPEELDQASFSRLSKRMEKAGLPPLPVGQRYRKKTYRQLFFSGDTLLEEGLLPCQGFTLNAITGIRDRNNGTWYGFVRDMIDPQRWINKFFSSMADVVASQAKGGLLAEAGSFLNEKNAQEDWSDPRSIVWLRQGGLGKIKERESAGVPAGLSQLLEFTVGSLPHVAGINLEFLGLASREQPGVLEHQRKQAAIATLAEFFNAMRLYRKQQGRVLADFLRRYLSDGRLVRIVGDANAQYVPLFRAVETVKYDMVVDEAPNSPDMKARTWDALTQMLPVAMKMGFPVPPEIIEYSPFPASLVAKWKEFAGPNAGMSPQVKEQLEQLQEENGALKEQNQQLQSKKEEAMAMLQIKQAEAQQSMQIEQQKAAMQMQIEREKMEMEKLKMSLELEKAQMQMQIEGMKARSSLQLQEEAGRQKMDMAEQQSQHAMQMAEREPADK